MSKQGGIKDIAKGRADVYRLAPADIHIMEGWNSRDFSTAENIDHVETLSRSIESVGVKKPLTVRWKDGKAYLTDGESRLRATRLAIERGAEIVSIPVMTEDRYASEADLLFTQIVGNSGKNLTSFEQAKAFKRLIDFGWSEKDIADKSGYTRAHVVSLLELQAAPEPIAAMVKDGSVAATTAITTMRAAKGDVDKAAKTLTDAVNTAKKQGKTRASARHVQGTGKTFKTEVREIFSRARIDPLVGSVMFPASDFKRMCELMNYDLETSKDTGRKA